jgi:hypothetical protein
MNVFISWSGTRSKTLAESLRDWLPLVINRIEPWISSKDTKLGGTWLTQLTQALSQSEAGIICLTPENLGSRWISFEAGALMRVPSATVVPFLYEVEPGKLEHPLGIFQSAKAEREQTRGLVQLLNEKISGKVLDGRILDRAFDRWWPDLESTISKLAVAPDKDDEETADLPPATLQHQRSSRNGAIAERYFLNHTSFLRPDKQEEFFRLTRVHAPHYDIRVIVDSFDDPELQDLDFVEYHLDRSYPNPVRRVLDRETKFLLKELANGEYLLVADLHLKGEPEPIRVYRYMTLWQSGPRIA